MNFTDLMAVFIIAIICGFATWGFFQSLRNEKEIERIHEKLSKLYFILQLQDKQIDCLSKIEKTLEK